MVSEQSVLDMESLNCLLVELSGPGMKRATAMILLRKQLQALESVGAVTPIVGPKACFHVSFSDNKAAAAARAALLAIPGCSVRSVAGMKLPHKATLVGEKNALAGCDAQRGRSEEGAHLRTPSTASSFEAETSGESGAEEHLAEEHLQLPSADKKKPSRPQFLSGLELSHLNWERFAKGQEWRQDLLLRCLPLELCKENRLEAFLSACGLKECVEQVEVTTKGRFGSAIVHATSVGAASKLAKFLHGRQLFNAKLPISVSFASEADRCATARDSRGGKALLPMHVQSSAWSSPVTISLPPGLEDYLAQLKQ
mmetsp:Transcript_18632/g.43799  ORF Transcript_18632/g.43799 Transcript_18632/m.43799 type:complete len:312 (-) Transcript_18632:50-985(-)|eukprot:CAMPEP_0171057370 /NCGR_PEP_ID=MMETSP0766_2-20121228/1747_1 /TAXON_ID=439317 /ORGANISM="Gambierdiscus australes, Strain CAWD 149" /LENGTH=311 /DNA_ID=CAMNT_0011512467 /DNA_START=59 /DNA_END=994 /DNA_ORIENTATION=-